MKPLHFRRFLSCLLFAIPPPGFCVECGESLVITQDTAPNVVSAKERFDDLVRSFKPDANVDTIFEVPIEGKSVDAIEKTISDGKENYFSSREQYHTYNDGFSQDYASLDGEWKKTIKVTTHNPKGQAIVPYLQIFYEDKFGGVIRLKPNGNSDAPGHLTHLKRPHGTQYFKVDPKGDLSFDNEAFKVYAIQAFPRVPNQVRLPEGVKFGTPEAEEFLKNCWTFKTHVPLSE